MKSDEEFIAGIYQKAEVRKMKEEKAAQNLQNTGRGHNFRAWRALAAAACLCLIVSGAVYARNLQKKVEESSPVQQSELPGENAVMALSLGEPGISSGEGDAAQEDNVNPRGRIAFEDENGDADGSGALKLRSVENAVAEALWVGLSLADSAVSQNPTGEDHKDVLPEGDVTDVPTGEDGGDLSGAGGN